MLSNAYLLAKFRFDSAESEPPKNLKIIICLILFPFRPSMGLFGVPGAGAPRTAGRRIQLPGPGRADHVRAFKH